MSCTVKKFIESNCKMTPILKSLCENECLFRNKKLKRYTCKIIPKDQYCVRPLCHNFFNKQPCLCYSCITCDNNNTCFKTS